MNYGLQNEYVPLPGSGFTKPFKPWFTSRFRTPRPNTGFTKPFKPWLKIPIKPVARKYKQTGFARPWVPYPIYVASYVRENRIARANLYQKNWNRKRRQIDAAYSKMLWRQNYNRNLQTAKLNSLPGKAIRSKKRYYPSKRERQSKFRGNYHGYNALGFKQE